MSVSAFPYGNQVGDVTYPTVAARQTGSYNSDTATQSITLPSHSAGQMLFVTITSEQGVVSNITSLTAGWTLFEQRASGGGVPFSIWIYKIASSGSETLSVTFANAITTAYISLAIDNADALYKVCSTLSTSSQPSSLSTGVVRPYLSLLTWNANSGTDDITSAPAHYTGLTTIANGVTQSAATAERQIMSATQSPGSWGVTGSPSRVTATFALYDFTATSGITYKEFNELWQTTTPNWTASGAAGGTTYEKTGTNEIDPFGFTTTIRIFRTTAGTDDGFWTWTGTFEDLGVPAGATVTGYSAASCWWRYRLYAASSAYFGDADGSTAAFEAIDTGGSRVLIPNQADPGTTTAWANAAMSTPISGLSLASNSSLNLRLHNHMTATGTTVLVLDVPTITVTYTGP